MLQYSPQQGVTCIKKLQQKVPALKALTAGWQAYWAWGKADGKWKHRAKKTSSVGLASSVYFCIPHDTLGRCWDTARQIFNFAQKINFGREGHLCQNSQVIETGPAGYCQTNRCFRIWSTRLQSRNHKDDRREEEGLRTNNSLETTRYYRFYQPNVFYLV